MSLLDFEQWEKFFRTSPTDAMMISRSLCRANAPDLAEQVTKNVTLLTLLKTQPLNIVMSGDASWATDSKIGEWGELHNRKPYAC